MGINDSRVTKNEPLVRFLYSFLSYVVLEAGSKNACSLIGDQSKVKGDHNIKINKSKWGAVFVGGRGWGGRCMAFCPRSLCE